MELEKGKLYQVRHWEYGWIIAEYISKTEASTVTGYRSTDGARSWHEPATHYWHTIVGKHGFRVWNKDLQVRPVSLLGSLRIARLQAEIERLRLESLAVVRELRELTQ